MSAAVAIPAIMQGISMMMAQDSKEDDREAIRQQQERNEALQREFAQNGVRWRVADAKAAGLHPLFALGAGGAAYAPNAIAVGGGDDGAGAVSQMGQGIGRALAAQETTQQQEARALSLNLLEAQIEKEYALAAAAWSEAGRTMSPVGSAPFPDVDSRQLTFPAEMRNFMDPREETGMVDAYRIKPDEMAAARSDDPSISAGRARPDWQEVTTGQGSKMILPGKDSTEAWESIGESWWLTLRTIQANVDKYGEGWLRKAGREVFGLRQLLDAQEHASGRLSELIEGAVQMWGSKGTKRNDWLDRRGISRDAQWTGRGPAPWNR